MNELLLQIVPAVIGLIATIVGAVMSRGSGAPQIVILDGKVLAPEQVSALTMPQAGAGALPAGVTLPPRNAAARFRLGTALVDGGIITALTALAGFVIGFALYAQPYETMLGALVLTNIVIVLGGLTVAATLRAHARWRHIAAVVIVLWLFSAMNVLLGYTSVQDWIVSLPFMFVLMAIAGGLSYLFRRRPAAA